MAMGRKGTRDPNCLRAVGVTAVPCDTATRDKLKELAQKTGLPVSHFLREIAYGRIKIDSDPQVPMSNLPGKQFNDNRISTAELGAVYFYKLAAVIAAAFGKELAPMQPFVTAEDRRASDEWLLGVIKNMPAEAKAILIDAAKNFEQDKAQLRLGQS